MINSRLGKGSVCLAVGCMLLDDKLSFLKLVGESTCYTPMLSYYIFCLAGDFCTIFTALDHTPENLTTAAPFGMLRAMMLQNAIPMFE
jgi:hypothetical protein